MSSAMSRRRTPPQPPTPTVLRFPGVAAPKPAPPPAPARGMEPIFADGELPRRLDALVAMLDKGVPAAEVQDHILGLKVELVRAVEDSREYRLPFGKFKGLTLAEVARVDLQYLFWLQSADYTGPVVRRQIIAFLAGCPTP